jgi:hypothetical protein
MSPLCLLPSTIKKATAGIIRAVLNDTVIL